MTAEEFHKIASHIPDKPGVYRFVSPDGEVLYVGKAKSLRKRLASYFRDSRTTSAKVRMLRRRAERIEYTITDTEQDALLLENTMIKRFQPRYNVQLKDGKTYVYIRITKERFPRVFFTRRVVRDGSTYFGPYTSKHKAEILLELIRTLFPLRTCTFHLSEENIRKGKYRPCLEYHIHNCNAPCVGLESEEAYNEKIQQIKNILRGRLRTVKDYIKEKMWRAAEELRFEEAEKWKNHLAAFDDYQSKSTVVSVQMGDIDVFAAQQDREHGFIQYLMVRDGAIIHSYAAEMELNLNEDFSEALSIAVQRIREKFESCAPEIICSQPIHYPSSEVKITMPQRGEKKKLLELAQKNLYYFIHQIKKQRASALQKKNSVQAVLEKLREDLQLSELPVHIECFDNSNIQGAYPVSSCVVFKDGRPAKSEYRHYHIKTVEGIDDFAMMQEVVHRRYRRLLEEGKSLPQLIVIDGGKGQLNAALASLKSLGLADKVHIIGIAKRLEEIYRPGDPYPLHIDKRSPSLKLIQQIRNEAHRFAVQFHRKTRQRRVLHTQLLEIPGVGEKTAQKLLAAFGSVEQVRRAEARTLAAVVGPGLALRIYRFFRQHDEEE